MAKKTEGFDPAMIDAVIQDVKDLSAPGQKLVADVVAMLKGHPKTSASPVSCGPNGCTDCAQCLCTVRDSLVQALCATMQAELCVKS